MTSQQLLGAESVETAAAAVGIGSHGNAVLSRTSRPAAVTQVAPSQARKAGNSLLQTSKAILFCGKNLLSDLRHFPVNGSVVRAATNPCKVARETVAADMEM